MSTDVAALVNDTIDVWISATERTSSPRRGRGKKQSFYGIEQLRALILDLAMRGKLVPQDASDEPATALLSKLAAERLRRIKSGEIKGSQGPSRPSSEPFDVPSGWTWIPLWKTGHIFTGNSISAALRSELEKNESGRPFIATKDVGYGLEPMDYDNGLVVSLDDQRFSVARPHTVFICAEGGSAGRKMAVSDREISFGNKLIANEPWSQIEPRFILYTYLSEFFFECFSKEMTGIIGGISRAKFLALPFPLPPLAEQQRIIAKVDELMALCDALETQSASALEAHQILVETLLATLVNASDTTDLTRQWARLEAHFDTLFSTESSLDSMRQTILDLAVRGLIVGQSSNDEPARKLLQRVGNQKRAQGRLHKEGRAAFEVPHGWEWAVVQELLNPNREISYGVIKLGPEPSSGGVPTLRCSDVKPGFVDLSSVRKVSEDIESDYARTRLEGGEVVINIRGTLGGVSVVNEELRGYNVAREVAVIPLSGEISNRFVVYLMMSSYFWGHIQENLRGIAYKGLNLGVLRDLPVPVPPVAEQQRIVAKVDELFSVCEALKAGLADAAETRRRLAAAIVERAAA